MANANTAKGLAYLSALAGMHKPVQTYVGNNPFNVAQYKPESATDLAMAKIKMQTEQIKQENMKQAGALDVARLEMFKEKQGWEKQDRADELQTKTDMANNPLLGMGDLSTSLTEETVQDVAKTESIFNSNSADEMTQKIKDVEDTLATPGVTLNTDQIKMLDDVQKIKKDFAEGKITVADRDLAVLQIAKESNKIKYNNKSNMSEVDASGELKKNDGFIAGIQKVWDSMPQNNEFHNWWESDLEYDESNEKYRKKREFESGKSATNQYSDFKIKLDRLQKRKDKNDKLRKSISSESLMKQIKKESKQVTSIHKEKRTTNKDKTTYMADVEKNTAREIQKIKAANMGVGATNKKIGLIMDSHKAQIARYQAVQDAESKFSFEKKKSALKINEEDRKQLAITTKESALETLKQAGPKYQKEAEKLAAEIAKLKDRSRD